MIGRGTDNRNPIPRGWADRWAWGVAVLALIALVALVPAAPVWRWQILPFVLSVVVIAAMVVFDRVPHSREWSGAGALAFTFAVFLGFGPVQASVVALVYPLARFAVERHRRRGSPTVAYVFLAGRMVLGMLAGGLTAGLVVDTRFWSPGDSDLGGLMPFAVGYLVVQLVALGGLQVSRPPAWEGRRRGRLASLGIPSLAQSAVWEALGAIGATATALLIDTVGLRLDYWVSCAVALAIIVGLTVTLDRNSLLRERNAELGRALAELRALNDVSQALSSTYESGALVEEIGEQVRRLTNADVVDIARLDPIHGRLRFLFSAHAGVRQPERFEQIAPAPAPAGKTGSAGAEPGIVVRSIRSGQTEQGTDVETYALARSDGTILPLDRSGVRHFQSAVAVPMTAGGEQIGAIAIKAHRPGIFSRSRIGLLERIAGQAGMAIRNAEVIAAERASDLARQDFLSVVSHELRTPITTISGYGQLLARRMAKLAPAGVDDGGSAEARMVDVIVRQSRQLGRLVDDLVLLSGLGRGNVRLYLVAVDLVGLARDAVDAVRSTIPDPAGLVLQVDGELVVEGDQNRLRQVLDNLLEQTASNANPQRPVTVRVGDLGDFAEIRVTDPAHRMSEAQRARIFEPFQRPEGDSGTGAAELGLSLNIVREIVVSHGGIVSAERAGETGTTYIVRLPIRGQAGGPTSVPDDVKDRQEGDRGGFDPSDREART